jgi:prefoldin alpha subunit
MSEKELQEKIMVYRIVESRIDALMRQRDLFLNKIVELQNSLASIDEIAKSKEEILFPIGSEAYSFGKVADKNKIIVEIGAGVALEKNFEEAKEIIQKRKNDIQTAVKEIQEDVQKLSQSLSSLEFEIQSLAGQKEDNEVKEAG